MEGVSLPCARAGLLSSASHPSGSSTRGEAVFPKLLELGSWDAPLFLHRSRTPTLVGKGSRTHNPSCAASGPAPRQDMPPLMPSHMSTPAPVTSQAGGCHHWAEVDPPRTPRHRTWAPEAITSSSLKTGEADSNQVCTGEPCTSEPKRQTQGDSTRTPKTFGLLESSFSIVLL